MVPDEIREKMEKVVMPPAVDKWWTWPIPAWDDLTPQEMWERDPQKVHDKVDSYLDPSYS